MLDLKLNDLEWTVDVGTGENKSEVDLTGIIRPAVESFSRSLTIAFSMNGKGFFTSEDPEHGIYDCVPCFALMTGEDGDINWGQYEFFNVTPMLKVFTDDLDMMAMDLEEVENRRENIIECLEGLIAGVRAHKVEEPC